MTFQELAEQAKQQIEDASVAHYDATGRIPPVVHVKSVDDRIEVSTCDIWQGDERTWEKIQTRRDADPLSTVFVFDLDGRRQVIAGGISIRMRVEAD